MTQKKTPEAWCEQYGLEVRDPDGWRADHTPWTEPLTLPEFWRRYTGSTARQLPGTDYERITADIQAAKRAEESAPGKLPGRRIRIETTLDHTGRPQPHTTSMQLDDQPLTDVSSIELRMNANDPHHAHIEIRRAQADTIGNGRPPAADPILCLGCLIDIHNHQRTEDPNPAQVILNGTSACLDHFQIQDGPVIPGRTPGGIILGNGS